MVDKKVKESLVSEATHTYAKKLLEWLNFTLAILANLLTIGRIIGVI